MAGAAEGVPPEEWREWAGCGWWFPEPRRLSEVTRWDEPGRHGGMAGAGAGAEQGAGAPGGPGAAAEGGPRPGPDWAGLPEHVLMKVAEKHIAQNEAGWAARLKEGGWPEKDIQMKMAKRKRKGNCLFVFARVCKPWRKAQIKVGGPLRTRVKSDVLLPGSVGLVKWALAEGCPRENETGSTLAYSAADYGHLELMKWLCGEGGFAMGKRVMNCAAANGRLELVKWLRGEGCLWSYDTCNWAIDKGHVEVLRWARENGCKWDAATRDEAATKLGYTDDLGNLVTIKSIW